jgi:hypothetical protein
VERQQLRWVALAAALATLLFVVIVGAVAIGAPALAEPGEAGAVSLAVPWLLASRRLTVRYERRADILTACLHLACALICARKLQPS